MAKQLSQIMFDFGAPPEEEKNLPAEEPVLPVAVEEMTIAAEPEPELQVVPVTVEEEEVELVTAAVSTKAVRKSPRGRTSLKELALTADLINVPPDEILFQKQYYSIGQVAAWFRVNQSLVRYWETEFDILQPRKNRKGDRFFRPIDVKNLLLIYDLLRRRKFTIEGAKDYLKKSKKAEERFAVIQSLQKMKSFLLELKAGL
jgi:DNA-binding transcriptional MerR regulator